MDLKNKKAHKGILFAGCSFTWGQGLYFYSGLSTVQEQDNEYTYDETRISKAQEKFMHTKRFPRKVANHFDRFEIVHPGNGGSNSSILAWWNACLFTHQAFDSRMEFFHLAEIELVVFQVTQTSRDDFINYGFPEGTRCDQYHLMHEHPDMLGEYLDKNNLTTDQWDDLVVQTSKERIKEWLSEFEKRGIKTVVLPWTKIFADAAKDDAWYNDRMCLLNYNEKEYTNIEDLMGQENPEMTIKYDQENFWIPPSDHHPSMTCHQVIANNLIKHITDKQLL